MGFVTVEDENGLGWAVPDGFGGTRLVYLLRKHRAGLGHSLDNRSERDEIGVEGFDGRAVAPSGTSPVRGVGGCALCRLTGSAE
jgi:hypothetical protein